MRFKSISKWGECGIPASVYKDPMLGFPGDAFRIFLHALGDFLAVHFDF